MLPWLTYADLCRDSKILARKLSGRGIDGVVGIARSGVLPAAIVAQNLHVPLFVFSPKSSSVTYIGGGSRLEESFPSPDRLVLIDDTCASGQSLAYASNVTGIGRGAVVYTTAAAAPRLFAYARILDLPHILEWNFWNSLYVSCVTTDLDGVLCPDPTEEDVADEERYRRWAENVQPWEGPRRSPVLAIISARPEWLRDITTRWLAKHGFKYKELILAPEFTRDWRSQIDWKAKVLEEKRPLIYIESSREIADALRARVRSYVIILCIEEILYGGTRYPPPRWGAPQSGNIP